MQEKENNKTTLYLKAKQAYYFGTPVMSDAQFDKLEEDLRNEDPSNPALALVGAPIPAGNQLQRAKHSMPMGSQEKVNSYEELTRWQHLRVANVEDFHASLKADGSSLGLYYKAGRLTQAITRGSGTEGEDITASAALFQNVPAQLPYPLTVSVRCEAVLTMGDWKRADPNLESNPRNVATGILGRLDGKEAHLISAFSFDIQEEGKNAAAYGLDLTTETGKCKAMVALGFTCSPWKGGLTLSEVQTFFEETKAKRNSLPFWIDGVVVKYDLLEIQEELGASSGRPKGQVAWKFPPEGARSKILDVFWQVGHTGAITPVAVIDPVRIGGTTVARASLANAENIKTLGVRLGASVRVIKAGDIIPQIVEVLEDDNTLAEIVTPSACPICGGGLESRRNVDGGTSVVLFCSNQECEAKTLGKIKRFCTSRDILGIGDSIIEALVNSGLVTTVPDLYTLTPEKMENLVINLEKGVRLGRKRAEGICSEVLAKAKKMSLPEFLGAFGTRALGVRRATLMLEANPELENIEAWFDGRLLNPEFAQTAGVPKMGAPIFEGLKENERAIRETLKEIKIIQPVAAPAPEPAPGGKLVCITGTLPSGKKKKDYEVPLAARGHKLVDDLTKGVDYLVVSDPAGPESAKTKKAGKLGIPIIGEPELIALTA